MRALRVNHHVTFPFLNCIENCNQNDLLEILPTLYHDLINNSTGSFLKYKLTRQNINIQEPDSKLSRKILEDVCLATAVAIKTQCSREYEFANENEKTRVTVLSELRIDELEGLQTNNLIAERHFSKSDRLWKVGKSRNCKFKAKVIRNNLDLINSDNFGVEKNAKKIMLILTDRETNWNDQRKMKLKLQLTEKIDYKGLH